MPPLVSQTITALGTFDYSMPNPRLLDLSDLGSEDKRLFAEAWAAIGTGVRRDIIDQLVELAEDNVEVNFDSIFRHCLRDSDVIVRVKAIQGLWECQDASLIKPMAELLTHDSSDEVQVAAAVSLGNFAMLAELGKIRAQYIPLISSSLLGILGDAKRAIEVRCRALEAAAPLSLPGVRDAIDRAYQGSQPALKTCALHAMGRTCDASWLPMIFQEMTNPDAEMRCGAAEAAGEIGEEEATPYLVGLVDDPDAEVAFAAIQSLGKVGGREAKKRLRSLLDEPEELVRQVAKEALVELEAQENPLGFGIGADDS